MELAALEKKLQRLRDAFLCGAEGIQEYKREKERLTAQANHLRQELLSSSREVCAASEQHDEIQKIVTTLEDLWHGGEIPGCPPCIGILYLEQGGGGGSAGLSSSAVIRRKVSFTQS